MVDTENNERTILVVEDEGYTVAHLNMLLETNDFRVLGPVATGEEAVEWAGEKRPDLVLMDIRLAGEMSGMKAAKEIKTKYDIPIAYLTAYPENVNDEEEKKVSAFLVKPVNDDTLISSLEEVLSDERNGTVTGGAHTNSAAEPVKCPHCSYSWTYEGDLLQATCPSCGLKVPLNNKTT